MSTQIDERVVAMKFDARDFDNNVRGTMSLLEKFEKELKFDGVEKGFDDLGKAADKVNLTNLGASATAVGEKFSAMSIVAISAINNIVNTAMNAGKQIVKSLTIDQVTAGFNKYEEKVKAVQTIMNATGLSIDEVSAQLDRLSWFTDETSYSFSDMVNNVGKFTSYNIPLDKAVTAMQGIANWAAVSGAGVNEAARAMYNLSQAMSKGYVQLLDWRSIETANMSTTEFKQAVLDAAVAVGTLRKEGELYSDIAGSFTVSTTDFSNNMSKGWFTSDVLMMALNRYGEYADAVFQRVQETGESCAEAMEHISGEMMELGEKAFKAGQEAKTFTDAIEATKDAVSTGWMRTFEMLFGNYEEAKDMWTELAGELYEIFASAGDERNAMLKSWVEMGGRVQLIATVKQAYGALLSVVEPLKQALDEMFPPMTAERLRVMIVHARSLFNAFKLSSKEAYTLKAAMKLLLIPVKALFVAFDVGIYAVGQLVKSLAKLSRGFLEMLATTNPVEDFFRDLLGDERYSRAMDALSTIVEKLGNMFAYVGKGIDDIIHRMTSSNKLVQIWQKLLDILAPIGDFILDVIVDGLEFLADLDFKDLENLGRNTLEIIRSKLGGIYDLIVDIGRTVAEYFGAAADFAGPLEGIATLQSSFLNLNTTIGNFKTAFTLDSILSGTGSLTEGLTKVVDSLGNSFTRLTERLSPAKILLFGFGTALTASLLSVTKAFNGISTLTTNFSTVVKNFGERLKPNKLAQIGKALLILAGALIVLSMVDADRLAQATISMGVLAGILLVLSAAMAAIDNYLVSDTNHISALTAGMVKISAALLILAAALKIISGIETAGLGKKVAAIIGIIVALGTVFVLMSRFVKKDISKSALFMVAYALAINSLIGALKKLEKLDANRLLGSMGSLIVLMGLLATMASMLKNVQFGGALGVTLMIGNLFLLMNALEQLAYMPIGTIINALPIYIGIVALLGVLMRSTKEAGENAAKAGVFILALSAAMIILGEAIKIIGAIDLKDAVQGGVIVSVMLGIFTLLTKATKDVGANTDKMSKAIVMMSISLMLLGVCISYLGNLDLKVALQGAGIVSVLLLVFAGIMKINQVVLKEKEKLAGGAGAILAMAALIGVMASTLALLTLLPQDEVMNAAQSLAIAMIGVGVAVKLMEKMNFKGAVKTAASMVVLMSVLTGVMWIMSKIETDETIIAKAAAISLMLMALAAAVRILPELGTIVGKDGFIVIAELTAVMGAMALMLYALKDLDPVNAIANATALSGMLIALVGAVRLLPAFTKVNIKNVSIILAELVGVMAVLGLVLWRMNDLDPINAIASAAALSVLIVAISGCARLLSGFRKQKMGPVSVMIWELVGVMYMLSLVLGIMNELDLEKSIANSISLGILLTALSASAMLLSGFKKADKSVTLVLGSLVVALGLLAGIMKLVEVLNIDMNLPLILKLSVMLVAIAGAARILAGFPKTDAGAVLGTLLAVEAALAVLIGIVWAVGQIPWDKAEESIKGFGTIGAAIGELIGQLVSHLISAGLSFLPILGTYLSDFVTNMFGFTEGIKKIDGQVLTGAANLAGAILLLTGAEFIQGITSILPGGGGNKSPLLSFGQQLVAFGPMMAEFAKSVSGIKGSQVVSMSLAVRALAEAYNYLNDGILDGIADVMFGENNLETFGKELAAFGPYFAEFAKSLQDVPQEALESTIAAAKCMAALEEGLPKHGGWVQAIFGDADLGEFGRNLLTFGIAIKAYSDIITSNGGIDKGAIESSVAAGEMLAKLENALRGHNGIFQTIFGDANLKTFGENLEDFGKGMKNYSDAITEGDGLNIAAITESAQAGTALAQLEKGLVGTNGAWQSIFGGAQDIGTFGTNLAGFGTALKDYSDAIEGVSFDRLVASARVGEMFSTLEASLPEDGGIFRWFDGVQDFGSFGEGLRALGGALAQYNDLISTVDLDRFTESVDGLENMVSLGDLMTRVPTDGMINFSKAMKKLADASINDFAMEFVTLTPTIVDSINILLNSVSNSVTTNVELLGIGNTMIDTITDQLIQNESRLTVRGQDIVGFLLMGMSTQHDNLRSQAIYLITVISDAIDSQTGTLKENIRNVVYTAIWNLQIDTDIYRAAKGIGSNVVKGIIEGLNSESGRLDKAVAAMSQGMITTSMKVLDEHSPSVVFKKIGGNTVKGMIEGIEQNEDELYQVMTSMNKDIIEQSENEFKIKDGTSGVMRDRVGVYLIKGLADGITADMSAEEAIEKKAANIVAAFQESLDRYSREMNISSAEYSLWESIYGETAKSDEVLARQREDYEKRLELQGKAVTEQQAIYEATLKQFGEDSKYTRDAYLNFIQEYQNFTDLGNEYLELINSGNTNTREAIEAAAQQYGEFMREIAPKLLEQGFTQEQIQKAAEQQTGFNPNITVGQTDENDIQSLIAKYVGYAETEIDAATAVIQTATKKSVSTGTRAGTSEGMTTGVANGVADAAPYLEDSGISAGEITGRGYKEGITKTIGELGNDMYGGMAWDMDMLAEGASDGLSSFGNTLKSGISKLVNGDLFGTWDDETGTNSPSKEMIKRGQYLVEGLLVGLTDNRYQLVEAMSQIATTILDSTSSETNTISDLGRMMADKIVEGLEQSANEVPGAVQTVMQTTLDTVANYNDQFYDVGIMLSDSMIDGLIDAVRNRQSEAINEIVQLATDMYNAAKSALSIGGVTTITAGLGGAGFALANTTSNSVWSNISGALEQAVVSGRISDDQYNSIKLQTINTSMSEIDPTIVPILDLSNIESGIAQINAMFSENMATNVATQMNDRQTNGNVQNGSAQNTAGATYYTFNQTNTSPKALSRIDIYRDTQRLLSSAKGV